MCRSQPVPRRWLMTDERLGEQLWTALRNLPPGSGIVFRHYYTPAVERRRLLRRVARIAAARRLIVVQAGAPIGGPIAGYHGVTGRGSPVTAPAHDRREAIQARRAGAAILFISPIFPTRSHPEATPLGAGRAYMIAANLGLPLIALAGMNERRFRRIRGFYGWAAIDAWGQKRKAVPI